MSTKKKSSTIIRAMIIKALSANGVKYSRMDQVKYVEDSL